MKSEHQHHTEEGIRTSSLVHLSAGKQFSRVLYSNPVCFLCTPGSSRSQYHDGSEYHANVMTVSWLTAINNEGRFVMSLNRRRYTANFFEVPGREFCLGVPTAGMESLVLAVGRVSGRVGNKIAARAPDEENTSDDVGKAESLSKRQRRKVELESLAKGVRGLEIVNFGGSSLDSGARDESGLFCIQGTVAHLRCRNVKVVTEDEVDDSHILVFSDVVDAFCHPNYWNESKNQFKPESGWPALLTFFGSQEFGHVATASPDLP